MNRKVRTDRPLGNYRDIPYPFIIFQNLLWNINIKINNEKEYNTSTIYIYSFVRWCIRIVEKCETSWCARNCESLFLSRTLSFKTMNHDRNTKEFCRRLLHTLRTGWITPWTVSMIKKTSRSSFKCFNFFKLKICISFVNSNGRWFGREL